jgi:hypothetical protein
MRIEQSCWTAGDGWRAEAAKGNAAGDCALVLAFGSREALATPGLLDDLRRRHPGARLVGCSTAGEIRGTEVHDDSLVATALAFDASSVRGACVRLERPDGFEAGSRLAAELPFEGLRHVFVLADGHAVNGTALLAGLASRLPASVSVTGGLAADGERFGETVVLWDEPLVGGVVAVGLYGERLRVGCGSLGGWDPFGPERLITRARGNVLYELDGQSALALYKRYLGEKAKGLPATALLFPLSLRGADGDASVVRTVLSIDEQEQSMTFAGDLPEGAYARLMKANFDRLIDGAVGRARHPDQLRRSQDGPAPAGGGGGRGRARGARRGDRAHRLLLLRRDLPVHADGALRAAQPDDDGDDVLGAIGV